MLDDEPAHGTCYEPRTMLERWRAARSRTPMWIGIAAALHALALAGLFLVPAGHGRGGEVATVPEPTELAISLEEAPGTTRERADEPPGAQARAETSLPLPAAAAALPERRATSGAATTAPGLSSSEPMTVAPGTEGPPGGAPGAAPSGGAAIPVPFTAAELGIGGSGGRNPFLPRAEEKPPSGGADHPAARAMRGTGLARDRELGLGPEGPAIAALSDATTSSIAPLRGRALFVVRTGGDGLVAGIDLVDSEGGSGWIDAGRIALERLRGKKFRVPSGANGLRMSIEVRSEMKLPNGENAPIGGRLGDNDMPELTIPDVSNIGAKPRRVIHARAAGTELL